MRSPWDLAAVARLARLIRGERRERRAHAQLGRRLARRARGARGARARGADPPRLDPRSARLQSRSTRGWRTASSRAERRSGASSWPRACRAGRVVAIPAGVDLDDLPVPDGGAFRTGAPAAFGRAPSSPVIGSRRDVPRLEGARASARGLRRGARRASDGHAAARRRRHPPRVGGGARARARVSRTRWSSPASAPTCRRCSPRWTASCWRRRARRACPSRCCRPSPPACRWSRATSAACPRWWPTGSRASSPRAGPPPRSPRASRECCPTRRRPSAARPAARALVEERFSHAASISRLLQLYDELLGARPPTLRPAA